tara:strand:- start:1757 stop:2071 length:315 start_codon:yes stop_codon:yes gene_type:complete
MSILQTEITDIKEKLSSLKNSEGQVPKENMAEYVKLTEKLLPLIEKEEVNNDILVMANARRLIKAHKRTSNARLCMELFGTGFTSATRYCREMGFDPDSNETHR